MYCKMFFIPHVLLERVLKARGRAGRNDFFFKEEICLAKLKGLQEGEGDSLDNFFFGAKGI